MKTQTLQFPLSLRNYSLEAVYQAAYAMLDRLYFRFDRPSQSELLAVIKAKPGVSPASLPELRDEFFNELLNSELRVMIAKRSRKIREALIAQALIGASSEKPDFVDDFMGIATPWEEKYGGKKKKAA